MENKVLVTGLGNGILGECSPCNYDAYQLICNPSMLLWIDKIVIPEKILHIIRNDTKDEENSIVQLILEFYDKAGLIESLNTDELFSDATKAVLESVVESDIKILTELDPELSKVEDNHSVIHYKGIEYCFPKLLSLYGDLFLAKETGANCLFSPSSIKYCHLKFGLTAQNPANGVNTAIGVDRVLRTMIPDIHPRPNFLAYNKCPECANLNDCRKKYYTSLGDSLHDYLEWRQYDEFFTLRECLDKILQKAKKHSDFVLPDDIVNSFEREKKRINSMIHRHLPKVKKYSDLITAISVPATILSAVNSTSLPLAVGTAALTGASALTSLAVNRIEEKYKWVNFTLK